MKAATRNKIAALSRESSALTDVLLEDLDLRDRTNDPFTRDVCSHNASPVSQRLDEIDAEIERAQREDP